ncbi:MAG: YfhO family protein [Planctomycetota bacterium]
MSPETAVPKSSAAAGQVPGPTASPPLWPAALALLLVVALLLAEGWLPGQVLVPLAPDDFPEWRVGQSVPEQDAHPNPNWCLSDVIHLLLPGLAVNAAAAERGELPLWDDSQALGVPHLHQIHYGVLYPPAWLPVALGFRGLHLMALLHLAAAGLGMLLYLTALGRTRCAALAGALAFALSAWVTARLQAFPAVGALVWLPWLLWGLQRASQIDGRTLHRVVASLALALSLLAGFPQVAVWVASLALLMELVRAGVALAQHRPWRSTLLAALAALALGVGLALPQLLPTWDTLSKDSLRTEATLESIVGQRVEPALLWHLLVPERYASTGLTGAHPLALADLEQAQNPAALNRAETSLGIGALGLLLACLALIFGRTWVIRTYAVLAVVTLAVLTVPALLEFAAQVCPFLRTGNPKRLLAVFSFALAVLAAGGLDLVRGHRLRVTVTAWALAVLFGALALVSRLSIPSVERPADIEYWAADLAAHLDQPGVDGPALLGLVPAENFRVAALTAADSSLLALAVAGFAILMFRPRRRATVAGWATRARRSPELLVGVLALELLVSAWPMLRTAPVEAVTPNPDRIGSLNAPALAGLVHAAAPAHGFPPRMLRFGNDPPWLRPNLPGLFGLADVQAYAPMVPRRYAELLAVADPAVLLSGSSLGGLQATAALTSPVLDLLGVDVLVTDRAELSAPGWQEHGRLGTVRVLSNAEAMPRATVVFDAELQVEDAARLSRLGAGDFDPRRVVLLEDERATATVASWPQGAPEASRKVSMQRLAPGRLRLQVEAGAPGVLLISEGYHEGWRATVAGQASEVLRANHALLAVLLTSPEASTVTLDFDPPLVRASLWAGGGSALLLLAWLLPWRRLSGR